MSYAANLTAGRKSMLHMLELDGDTVLSLDSTSGWSVSGAGASLATTATCKEGAAGLTFDKNNSSTSANIINSTLTPFNLTDSAYLAFWIFMPTLTGVTQVRFNVGQNDTDKYQWQYDVSILEVGWNWLRADINIQGTGVTLVPQGSYSPLACDTIKFTVFTSVAGTTLTGIIVDWVTKHPSRWSTTKISYPRATTGQGMMLPPKIGKHTYDPQYGTLSVAAAEVELVDSGDPDLMSELADWAILGRKTTIEQSFRGETENDDNFEPIFRGVIDHIAHTGRGWRYTMGDNLRLFRVPFAQLAAEGSPLVISSRNAITLALQVMLSTGNGTNSSYDVLAADQGAGIHQDLVDIAGIEQERDDFLTSDLMEFEFREPEGDFLTWFFTEICRPLGIMPRILGDGRISIKVCRPPYGAEQVNTFDRSNIIVAELPEFTQEREDIFNQIYLKYGWDAATKEFTATPITSENATSIARYGIRRLEIESKGIQDSDTATRVTKRILNKLGLGAPPLRIMAPASAQTIELGEVVAVTVERSVPDLDAGVYGVDSKLAEVQARGWNPESGKCEFDLFFTSYQQGNYRLIGPSGMTGPYDSNSASQNANYGSIADSSDFLGAANDPAHVIGPV